MSGENGSERLLYSSRHHIRPVYPTQVLVACTWPGRDAEAEGHRHLPQGASLPVEDHSQPQQAGSYAQGLGPQGLRLPRLAELARKAAARSGLLLWHSR